MPDSEDGGGQGYKELGRCEADVAQQIWREEAEKITKMGMRMV